MRKIALIALLAVVSTGVPKTSPMFASLRYDWVTDAVIWIHNKLVPFQYLTQWSGRTP